MKLIATLNMNINPEFCLIIDREIYSIKVEKSQRAIELEKVFRVELLTLLRSINVIAAEREKDACLYRICSAIERLQSDWGKLNNERGHANMQTAHNQLRNWK